MFENCQDANQKLESSPQLFRTNPLVLDESIVSEATQEEVIKALTAYRNKKRAPSNDFDSIRSTDTP